MAVRMRKQRLTQKSTERRENVVSILGERIIIYNSRQGVNCSSGHTLLLSLVSFLLSLSPHESLETLFTFPAERVSYE